jgi:hypothetical protein
MTDEGLAADCAALPSQKLCRVLMEIEARLEIQHRWCPFFMVLKKLKRVPFFMALKNYAVA